jgi:hypothetical protein
MRLLALEQNRGVVELRGEQAIIRPLRGDDLDA